LFHHLFVEIIGDNISQ